MSVCALSRRGGRSIIRPEPGGGRVFVCRVLKSSETIGWGDWQDRQVCGLDSTAGSSSGGGGLHDLHMPAPPALWRKYWCLPLSQKIPQRSFSCKHTAAKQKHWHGFNFKVDLGRPITQWFPGVASSRDDWSNDEDKFHILSNVTSSGTFKLEYNFEDGFYLLVFFY